ncbi:MAG: cupredoxin domain-containing protein [Chloroflexi bacterium]|nr:cupredoxin domain-containing protein [Chloroflexota bacterium]MBI2975700.1 cupredoxin domain-containing protein [Chloroflexota bacterium]MBI3177181.1 cupredoxin domain-containing protein [Chloroflexota bacterium]MBI4314518.1 cupredoxin domain-containing protein [Chloroflexota bacterium]MBI5290928.1 cupredoxin domain-containing protein [Chloroflexota bacterium]
MISKRTFFLATTLIMMTLAACGGSGGGSSAQPALAITLHAKDIAYDANAITAQAGQTLNVTFVNDGTLDHSFIIDGVLGEQKAAAGHTITFSFTPGSAGTYEFYCAVPGHKQAGMVGTLTVTP